MAIQPPGIPFVNNNVEIIRDVKKSLKTEENIAKKVWVNITTGQILQDKPSLKGKTEDKNWKVIDLTLNSLKSENPFYPIQFNGMAQKTIDATLELFRKKKDKTLPQTTAPVSSSQTTPKLISQTTPLAYSNDNVSTKHQIQEQSLVCFDQTLTGETITELSTQALDLLEKRLISPDPLKKREIDLIQNLFQLFLIEQSLSQAIFQNMSYRVLASLHSTLEAMNKESTASSEASGKNSSFFMKNSTGEKLWVYKPRNGESGVREGEEIFWDGIKPGDGAKREQLAHLLNYHGMFPIPYTCFIDIEGESAKDNVGSFQMFAADCQPFSKILLKTDQAELAKIPLGSMQATLVYDLLFWNCDRHGDNVLVNKMFQIFAIDNGACMSGSFQDPLKLEFLTVPSVILNGFQDPIKNLILRQNDEARNEELMLSRNIEKLAIDWMKFVSRFLRMGVNLSEDYKQNKQVELSAADISILLLKCRDQVWQNRDNDENLGNYLKNILDWKVHIQDQLPKTQMIAKLLMFNRRLQGIDEGWKSVLEELIIKPYINELMKKNK